MICKNCKTKNNELAKFCKSCGAELNVEIMEDRGDKAFKDDGEVEKRESVPEQFTEQIEYENSHDSSNNIDEIEKKQENEKHHKKKNVGFRLRLGLLVAVMLIMIGGWISTDNGDLNHIAKNNASVKNVIMNKCGELSIPVVQMNDLPEGTLGQFTYESFKNENGEIVYNKDSFRIKIRPQYTESPFIIAHELGHVAGLMADDDTEAFANSYAKNLIYPYMSFLERMEFELIFRLQGRSILKDDEFKGKIARMHDLKITTNAEIYYNNNANSVAADAASADQSQTNETTSDVEIFNNDGSITFQGDLINTEEEMINYLNHGGGIGNTSYCYYIDIGLDMEKLEKEYPDQFTVGE